MSHIIAAGNIEVPAYLAIGQLGFEIERQVSENDKEWWVARKGDEMFSAGSPLDILGLCLMRQIRGEEWKATDQEIDSYLLKYYPDAFPPDQK